MNDRTPTSVVLQWTTAALSTLYLLQAASPLRTDYDAIDYLRTATALVDGRTPPRVSLPQGYPLILAALDRTGLGSSFFFILANCFFLGIGLTALWRLLDNYPSRIRQWAILLTLLATPVIRSVAIPLPEAAFFGTSFLVLWALTAALSGGGRKRALMLAAAFGLACLAVSIRYVGMALFPALVWSCISPGKPLRAGTRLRWQVGPWAIAMVMLLTIVAVILSRTFTFFVYALQARHVYSHGVLASLPGRFTGMFRSLGELAVNLPFSRFHQLKPVYLIAGVLAAFGLLAFVRRPIRITPTSVYLISYLALLFLWPHDSSRLWMPIAPLIIAHAAAAAGQLWNVRRWKPLVGGYVAWFIMTGIGALAYTTRISFAGDDFSRLYRNNGGLSSDSPPEKSAMPSEIARYNAEVRSLMLRYGGWHARR